MRVVEATRCTSIMISYFMLDGDLFSMNPAATEAFSFGRVSDSEKEMVDARSKVFSARFVDLSDGITLLKAISHGEEPRGEFLIATVSGKRWHRLDLHRGRDPVSSLPVIVVVEEDVSTSKQALQDLENLNRTLEEKVEERTTALQLARRQSEDANRAKSDFLARMSQDLCTPLNAILGFSDILSTDTTRKLTAERFQEYGQNIHIVADSLLTLVNDLLDLSRIETGQFPIHSEEFVLGPLVEETAEFSRDSFEARNIGLDCQIARDVTVASDRRAISQILSNLLSSGLKYTDPTGRVSVTVAAATTTYRA